MIEELREIVGAAHVLEGDLTAGYATDWTGRFVGSTPAVVRPGTTDEVGELVEWARRSGTALVPQGGNTGLVGGGVPLHAEVVLSTSRFDGVELDAAAGQATAGAGVTIGDLQRHAARAGWAYGVDFGARDTATLGGSIATNAGGAHVMRYGMTRAQLLGVEAVLGNGLVVSHLGGLEKDNTGYDYAGLLCGSEGTLGIITRARLRLVPLLSERVCALLGFDSVSDAVEAATVLQQEVEGLEALEFMLDDGLRLVAAHVGSAPPFDDADPRPAIVVLAEAAGRRDPTPTLAAAVEHLELRLVAVATDEARRAELWRWRELHSEAINAIEPPVKLDVTLPRRHLAAFIEGTEGWLFGHLGDGNVHVNITGGDEEARVAAVLSDVVRHGGSISAEHGIGSAKRSILHLSRSPAELEAMAAIKAVFDPDRVLNPNVLLGPSPERP